MFFTAVMVTLATGAHAVTSRATTTTSAARSALNNAATPTSAYNYNYMYPYLNNQMRTDLNPGVTPDLSANPISVITQTEQMNPGRRVVARGTTSARSATPTGATTSAAVRAATSAVGSARAATASAARSATPATGTTTNAARGCTWPHRQCQHRAQCPRRRIV